MAEYVDGNEKAPLSSSAGVGRRVVHKPDWTRFGLESGGDGEGRPAAARGKPAGGGDASATRSDEDAGEVNEIYAEHEVHFSPRGPARYCR